MIHTMRNRSRRFSPRTQLGVVAAGLSLILLSGCAASGVRADYVFVYLKTGPQSGKQSPAESQEIFKGHMSNMHRLADEKKLIVAGPFDKPHDASWRGIFILDVASVDDARRLVATDPGVIAGVFAPDFHPFQASPVLRDTLDLEKAQSRAQASRPAGEPPPNVRGYVMLTVRDGRVARTALQKTGLSEKVIWSGRFGDARQGGGVFVLDETSPAAVEDAFKQAAADPGVCSVDGWWSTTALIRLKRTAGN